MTQATITVHRDDDDETYVGHSDVTVYDAQGRLDCRSLYALTLAPQ